MIRACIRTTAILSALANFGCVTSRVVTLYVSDIQSGEPIESARVTVDHTGVFFKFGARSVPSTQEGFTDQHGKWRGRCADGLGGFSVFAPGYGSVFIGLGPDWRWPEDIQIGFYGRARPEAREGGTSQ